MSMYLYKYTPILYTKHICTPKSGHSAASGPPLSRATAAVAAQWWPSSSAAWQNWQTVGKVFRFYPDPYCFGQNWPAFFISHPNKNIVLSIRSPNTFWRTERAKIPTQQWVVHSRIKREPWQGYQQQPPLTLFHGIWSQNIMESKIYIIELPVTQKKHNIYNVDSTTCLWSICEDSSQGLTTHRDPWQSQHDRIWCKSIWNMPPGRSQRLILLWRLLPVSAEHVLNS